MKKITRIFITLIVFVAFALPAFAAHPVEKLKGGITTIVKSPLLVKDHAMTETKDGHFLPLALPGGLLKGLFYMGKDMVHGAVDIVTFPIDK